MEAGSALLMLLPGSWRRLVSSWKDPETAASAQVEEAPEEATRKKLTPTLVAVAMGCT